MYQTLMLLHRNGSCKLFIVTTRCFVAGVTETMRQELGRGGGHLRAATLGLLFQLYCTAWKPAENASRLQECCCIRLNS